MYTRVLLACPLLGARFVLFRSVLYQWFHCIIFPYVLYTDNFSAGVHESEPVQGAVYAGAGGRRDTGRVRRGDAGEGTEH